MNEPSIRFAVVNKSSSLAPVFAEPVEIKASAHKKVAASMKARRNFLVDHATRAMASL